MQVFGMPSYYFNPRSYKRSDSRTSSKYDRSDFISIHAPTRGATTSFAATICKLRLFQSTLLQEERLGADIMFLCSDNISIHAPTRGATRFRFRDNISTFYFNPRSYKRSDLLRHDLLWELLLFQSTLLQEERLCLFPEIFQLSSISIHAPTRGATSRTSTLSFCICISIHAPTRGATFIVVSAVPARIISIHAPTRGATILVRMFLLNYIFQSTLLQEERLI